MRVDGCCLEESERASERIASQICLGEKRRGEKWVMRRGMRVYLRVLLAMGAICDVCGGGVGDGRWQTTTWAMFECNVDSERKEKKGGEAGFVAMLVGLRDERWRPRGRLSSERVPHHQKVYLSLALPVLLWYVGV